MNDADRQQWVDNDEDLYDWWRASGVGQTRFVREHRREIDAHVAARLGR